MRTRWSNLVIVAALAFILAANLTLADEQKVPLDKLPKAVTEAVTKRFPKAKLVDAAKETEGGKTAYEVTIKDGGTKIDVTLTPEGVITLLEKTIAAKDLPGAVTDGLKAKYPKGTIKSAEVIIKVKEGKETLDYYEVVLITGDKTLEVGVTAEGKIKKTEEKTK